MSCSSSVARALPIRLIVLALFISPSLHAGQGATAPIFQPPTFVDSGGFATESAAVADVNRDGMPDLVVAIQNDPGGAHLTNGLVGVLLGHGDGTFDLPVTYDTGGNDAVSVAVADLNADGAPDIIVGHYCVWVGDTCSFTTAGVLLGRGDGTFAPANQVNLGGSSSQQIAIADINGDGKPDLLATVAIPFNAAVATLIGNGDGTFQSPTFVPLSNTILYALVVGDINGDGRPDVVASGAGANGSGSSRGIARVLLGNGDGTFQLSPTVYDSGVSAGGWANSVVLGDLNEDGALDLAIANYPDNATGVLLGNGDGTFGPTALHDSGSRLAWANTIADVNGDGKRDLIVANAGGVIGVLLGNGDGTLRPPQTYAIPGALSVVAADINRDDRPDLAVAVGNNLTAVLLNNPSCTGAAPVVTVAAAPRILWPPNGRAIPVSLSGSIAASDCSLNLTSARYVVRDDYGQFQPQGSIAIRSDGTFVFDVQLPASRRGDDRDGRHYTITISAQTSGGATGSATTIVTVPHNR